MLFNYSVQYNINSKEENPQNTLGQTSDENFFLRILILQYRSGNAKDDSCNSNQNKEALKPIKEGGGIQKNKIKK